MFVSQMSWGVLQGGGEGAILAKKRQRESEEKNNAVSFFLTLYVRLFILFALAFLFLTLRGRSTLDIFVSAKIFRTSQDFFCFLSVCVHLTLTTFFPCFLLFLFPFLIRILSVSVFISSFSRHHFLFRNFNFFICKDADIRFCTRRARKGMTDENGRCPAHRLGKRFQAVSFLESFVLW